MAWAVIEPGILFVLIVVYIWWIRPFLPLFWVALLGYVLVSHAARGETPARLGFRIAGFRESARRYGPVVCAIALALLAAGIGAGSVRDISPRWAAINFVVYCFWGIFQQYLLNGYFFNRFGRFTAHAAALAALAFALAHAPNWFLMAVTAGGGYAAACAYQRYRNLYFVGLSHALLGFLIYMVVPDRVTHHLWVGPKWFRP